MLLFLWGVGDPRVMFLSHSPLFVWAQVETFIKLSQVLFKPSMGVFLDYSFKYYVRLYSQFSIDLFVYFGLPEDVKSL